jgi:hypothetical protein
LSRAKLTRVIASAASRREDGVLGVRPVGFGEDAIDDPWTLPPSRRQSEPRITGPMPQKVKVVSGNMLFIAKEGLPDALINRLVRLAAFQNPVFYQAQSLRLSTFGKPRIIGCDVRAWQRFFDHARGATAAELRQR